MSRVYRLSLDRSRRHVVRSSDSVRTELELLPVLPREQLDALLTAALVEAGFEPDEQGAWVRIEADGIVISVDPVSRAVHLSLEREAVIELERRASRSGYNRETTEAALESELSARLDAGAEQADAEGQSALTEHLGRRLNELLPVLDGIVDRVLREALRRKAASMGEIKQISEDPETGALVIKVEI